MTNIEIPELDKTAEKRCIFTLCENIVSDRILKCTKKTLLV